MDASQDNADGFVSDVAAFLNSLEARKLSPATVALRRTGIASFLSFLAEVGVERFQDVSASVPGEYRMALQDSDLKANSVDTYLRSVRVLFGFLAAENRLFENPFAGFSLAVPKTDLPHVIDTGQVDRLLSMPSVREPVGLRDRAIMEILYGCGLRRAELVELTMFSPEPGEGTIRVMGKGRKERVLPLGKHARLYLERYLDTARPALLPTAADPDLNALWLSSRGGPLSGSCFARRFKDYVRTAGIDPDTSLHTLRRSCATHMLANGAHPLMVANMLGHEDLKTLSHYLRVSIAELKETHARSKPGR